MIHGNYAQSYALTLPISLILTGLLTRNIFVVIVALMSYYSGTQTQASKWLMERVSSRTQNGPLRTVYLDGMYRVSENCKISGIWPPYSDGTDINAVDRSNQFHKNNCELLATVDDFGKLRILRYPSIEEKSKGVEGKGHSSHVTNVKFSLDDHYVLTTGGNDQCVFQWKLTE